MIEMSSNQTNVTNIKARNLENSEQIVMNMKPVKMKSTVTIVGNGTSRQGADLKTIHSLGHMFGCNAFFEEYPDVDKLFAVDTKMIQEIAASSQRSKLYVPITADLWEPREMHNGMGIPRNNAGMLAALKAIEWGAKDLIMIGFDTLAAEPDVATSNVYDGRANYGPETRASLQDTRRRLNYIHWMVNKHNTVNFYFVYPENYTAYVLPIPNVYMMCYNDLYRWEEYPK